MTYPPRTSNPTYNFVARFLKGKPARTILLTWNFDHSCDGRTSVHFPLMIYPFVCHRSRGLVSLFVSCVVAVRAQRWYISIVPGRWAAQCMCVSLSSQPEIGPRGIHLPGLSWTEARYRCNGVYGVIITFGWPYIVI